MPSLLIDVGRNFDELERIQRGVKGIKIGRTVGAGHFNMLETPDQFNAMLRMFIRQIGDGTK